MAEQNDPPDESPTTEPSGAPLQPQPPQASEPVDRLNLPEQRELEQQREDIRGTLSIVLLFIFGATLAAGFVAVLLGGEVWANARDYLQIAIPAVTGLLGSAMGFYFGSRRM